MPQDQLARFEYIQWRDIYKTEKPYEIFIDLPPELKDTQRSNLIFKPQGTQKVEDARGRETEFNLDTHGFAWRKHETKVKDFKSREEVVNNYFPEMVALIRSEVEDVDRVYIFDWRVSNEVAHFRRLFHLTE